MKVFMYKITATIEKEGGTPTNWTRYSKSKLTKSECEKMLSGKKEAGVSREQKVKLISPRITAEGYNVKGRGFTNYILMADDMLPAESK